MQSLPTHIDSLRSYVTDPHATKPAVVAVVETQIPRNWNRFNLGIAGYDCWYKSSEPSEVHRHGSPGGGVAVYFEKGVLWEYLENASQNRLGTPRVNDPEYGRTSSSHWFRIKLRNQPNKMLLNVVYVSPQANRYSLAIQTYLESLRTMIEMHEHWPILVCGDFNLRHPTWDGGLTHTDTASSLQVLASSFLTNLTNDLQLTLLNTHCVGSRLKHTRPASNSTLDLCFANEQMLDSVEDLEIGNAFFADHLPLHLRLHSAAQPRNDDNEFLHWKWRIHCNPPRWHAKLPGHLDSLLFTDHTLAHSLDLMSKGISDRDHAQVLMQQTWSHFLGLLNEAMRTCIGQSRTKPDSYPWFTPDVRAQHQRVCRARQRWRQKKQSDFLLAQYRAEQRQLKRISTLARIESLEKFRESVLTDPKASLLWSVISKIRKKRRDRSTTHFTVPNADGSPPNSPEEGLENLCKHFINTTISERGIDPTVEAELQNFVSHCVQDDTQTHESDSWSWDGDEVSAQCMRQRNHNSAAGPDQVPPVVLKHLGPKCYETLAIIFSFSWKSAVLPQEWTESNVFALRKDATKPFSDRNNFRPISVSSIFTRTLEHLIHSKLAALIDPHQQLPSCQPPEDAEPSRIQSDLQSKLHVHQFGFRAQRSCENALHMVISTIQEEQRKRHTGSGCLLSPVVFIDLRKAFDRVHHLTLLATLRRDNGITGTALKWLRSWLTNRRQRCIGSGHASRWLPASNFGVPQGAVLSPLLFAIFIDPIASRIRKHCPLVLMPCFADDIALLTRPAASFVAWWRKARNDPEVQSTIAANEQNFKKQASTSRSKLAQYRDLANHTQMKQALELLSAWLRAVGMQANAEKTKVVAFTSGRGPTQGWHQNLELDGFTIQEATSYDYLGLTLDQNMRWKPHQQAVLARTRAAADGVCRLFSGRRGPHALAALFLVRAIVLPTATYGCQFWIDDTKQEQNKRGYIDMITTQILRPLRQACDLPITTHRLGLAIDFALPSLEHVAKARAASYFQKYRKQIPQASLETGSWANQEDLLHPAVIRTIQDAYDTNCTSKHLLAIAKWTTSGARARFAILPECERIVQQAKQDETLKVTSMVTSLPIHDSPSDVSSDWYSASQLRNIAQLGTFLNWRAQATDRTHARATQAPLTKIKKTPGLTLILRFVTDRLALRTLMRLRHGRAYTRDIRTRFPSSQTDSDIDPRCDFGPCREGDINDSVEHLLVECPRNDLRRRQLCLAWSVLYTDASSPQTRPSRQRSTHAQHQQQPPPQQQQQPQARWQLRCRNPRPHLSNDQTRNHQTQANPFPHPNPRSMAISSTADLSLDLLLGEFPESLLSTIRSDSPTSTIKLQQQFLQKWFDALSGFILGVYHSLPVTAQFPKPL